MNLFDLALARYLGGSSGGGGSDIVSYFVIHGVAEEGPTYTLDKTFEEIYQATTNGQVPIIVMEGEQDIPTIYQCEDSVDISGIGFFRVTFGSETLFILELGVTSEGVSFNTYHFYF